MGCDHIFSGCLTAQNSRNDHVKGNGGSGDTHPPSFFSFSSSLKIIEKMRWGGKLARVPQIRWGRASTLCYTVHVFVCVWLNDPEIAPIIIIITHLIERRIERDMLGGGGCLSPLGRLKGINGHNWEWVDGDPLTWPHATHHHNIFSPFNFRWFAHTLDNALGIECTCVRETERLAQSSQMPNLKWNYNFQVLP